MKKFIALTIFALLTASNSFAAETSLSSCLSIDEQKTLGRLLVELDKAIAADPYCLNSRGDSCLSPRSEHVKEILENRLKACAKE